MCESDYLCNATLTSETKAYNFYDQKANLHIALFKGYGNKLNSEIAKLLENDLAKSFPKHTRTITNARNALKFSFIEKETFVSSSGCGLEVSSNELKISSRLLQEILAGKIPWDKIFYYLGFEGISGSISIPNRFLTMLNSGKIFGEIIIENGEDEKDDDWIVFKFKDDPAISPFRIPNIYK